MDATSQIPNSIAFRSKYVPALAEILPKSRWPQQMEDILAKKQVAEEVMVQSLWNEIPLSYREVALSRAYHLPVLPVQLDVSAQKILTAKECETEGVLVLSCSEIGVVAATPYPWMSAMISSKVSKASKVPNSKVVLGYCREDQFNSLLQTLRLRQSHGSESENALVKEYSSKVTEIQELRLDVLDSEIDIEKKPTYRLLKDVLEFAVNKEVTDIHFEPMLNATTREVDLQIRRRNGLLFPIEFTERRDGKYWTEVLKNTFVSLCEISEKSKNLDGKFRLRIRKSGFPVPITLEIRFASGVVRYGYHISLRILDKTKKLPTLSELFRYAPELGKLVRRSIDLPDGGIVVCGPTGSGKTTTLSTMVQELDTMTYMVYSLEDPPEYELFGVTQYDLNDYKTDANPKPWNQILESLLRKDPDIIMIGEIREKSVGKTTVETVLTGHQVFTTLHCKSVTEFPSRVQTLEINVHEFVNTLSMVMSQRIIRKLCSCATPMHFISIQDATDWLTNNQLPIEWAEEIVGDAERSQLRICSKGSKGGAGNCAICGGQGYHGIFAVAEGLDFTDRELRRLFREARDKNRTLDSGEIEEYCDKNKIPLMPISALRAIFAGVTDVEAVRAVIGDFDYEVRKCNKAFDEKKTPTWVWDINSFEPV